MALARINYRWNIPYTADSSPTSSPASTQQDFDSRDKFNFQTDYHPFPFPIHDTLQAWAFITETFLPSLLPSEPSKLQEPKSRDIEFPGTSSTGLNNIVLKRPIIIYGEFLGASIATSLALTENYESFIHPNTHDIRLIVKQGVYDWSDIGTTLLSKDFPKADPTPGSRIDLNSFWNKAYLLFLRKHLFSGPGRCLDAFASPSLFFRQAGISAPSDWAGLNQPSSYFCPCWVRDVLDPSASKDSKHQKNKSLLEKIYENETTTLDKVQRLKIAHTSLSSRPYLEFPPIISGLRIPKTLILYKDNSEFEKDYSQHKEKEIFSSKLSDVTPMCQATDLAYSMKRSLKYYSYHDRDPELVINLQELEDDSQKEQKIVKNWLDMTA